MLTLSPVALKAIVDAPDTFLDPGWETGYHKLLAVMGEHHPEWTEGVKVVPNDGEERSSGVQYREYMINLIRKGVQIKVENCRSYWMINRIESVMEGVEHKYITLQYVSNFGNVFTGHGVEYFPLGSSFMVFGALRHRVKHNLTTVRSPFGFATADEANSMFGHVGVEDAY